MMRNKTKVRFKQAQTEEEKNAHTLNQHRIIYSFRYKN